MAWNLSFQQMLKFLNANPMSLQVKPTQKQPVSSESFIPMFLDTIAPYLALIKASVLIFSSSTKTHMLTMISSLNFPNSLYDTQTLKSLAIPCHNNFVIKWSSLFELVCLISWMEWEAVQHQKLPNLRWPWRFLTGVNFINILFKTLSCKRLCAVFL